MEDHTTWNIFKATENKLNALPLPLWRFDEIDTFGKLGFRGLKATKE